jgi:arylsulfatase A-like enzyme
MARMAHYQHETDWFVVRTMLRACDWLEDNYERERFFLWVDSFEPHEIWRAPDYYTALYSPTYKGVDYAYPNYSYADRYEVHELDRLRARYAAEVTLTDRWVGHLLQQIEYMRLFENSVVILTSDHGMYLGEHNRVGKHTVDPDDPWPLLDEVVRVPLLVWTPWSNAPKVADALVQCADLMPTILDVCGIPPDAPYGRSYVPILQGQTEHHWEHVFSSCFSWEGPGRIAFLRSLITVTTPEWSLVIGPPPHTPELYDRGKDPRQVCNVGTEHPEIIEQLRKHLVLFMRKQGADPKYVSMIEGASAD